MPPRKSTDNGSNFDYSHSNPRLGEGESKGMKSGNSTETLGNSARDNSRNVGESKRGSKAPGNSGSGKWGMEDMAQNYSGDNTQKPSGKTGLRPEMHSKGEVSGVTTPRGGGDEAKFKGGTRDMKGMSGRKSGGGHGDWHEKRGKM